MRTGTYVQCESLSLSRDIPLGFGWLIGPFVTSIPAGVARVHVAGDAGGDLQLMQA